MGWVDRVYFRRMDRWLAGWAEQYDDADCNTIAEALEASRECCNEQEEILLDEVLSCTEVDAIHEGAASWFSDCMKPKLDMRAALKKKAGRIHPWVYAENVQPYLEATRPALDFVIACNTAHSRVGKLRHNDANMIFNGMYGGLEGFLASEQRINDTRGPAMAVLRMPSEVAPEVRLDRYRMITDQAFQFSFAAIFRGIEEYKPNIRGGQIILEAPKGPFPISVLGSNL
jgi:hypothetical protein